MSQPTDVKSSPVLPQGLQPSTESSLSRIAGLAEAMGRIRTILSSSSSSKADISPEDQQILQQLYSLKVGSAPGTGIKCFTSLAGNLAADNLAASPGGFLNPIAAGDGKNQRVGNDVRCIRAEFRFRGLAKSISQAFAVQEAPVFRSILAWDKMPLIGDTLGEIVSSGAATSNNTGYLVVAGNAGLVEGCAHPVTRHTRYEELHDEIHRPHWQTIGVSATNSQTSTVVLGTADINMHGRKTTFVSAVGQTPLAGAILYWVVADADQDAVIALTYDYCFNLYFVDDS